MPICVNSRCKRSLQETWQFCPACGSDCRPPVQRRHAILDCSHDYVEALPFCPMCGYSHETLKQTERVADTLLYRRGLNLVIIGVSLVAVALILYWIIEGSYGAAQVLVDQEEAGKSLRDPIAKERGRSVASPYLTVAGAICLLIGAQTIRKSKSRNFD